MSMTPIWRKQIRPSPRDQQHQRIPRRVAGDVYRRNRSGPRPGPGVPDDRRRKVLDFPRHSCGVFRWGATAPEPNANFYEVLKKGRRLPLDCAVKKYKKVREVHAAPKKTLAPKRISKTSPTCWRGQTNSGGGGRTDICSRCSKIRHRCSWGPRVGASTKTSQTLLVGRSQVCSSTSRIRKKKKRRGKKKRRERKKRRSILYINSPGGGR